MERRKDSQGRVLKSGETQRPNGTYMYRYYDVRNKRRCVYGKTLTELRKKEMSLQKDIADEIDISAGEMSVAQLVQLYFSLKRGLSPNSMRAYSTNVKYIQESYFGKYKINQVKLSHAKKFYVDLHDQGMKRNTIIGYHSILRPAFEMAVDDDMIRKNPFKFQVADLLPNDAEVRVALTPKQQEEYLRFIREAGNEQYYDEIVILLETGLRVSELYGLTIADLDFERRRIHIDHQLCRTAEEPYFVKGPKTSSGFRYIPMTDTAYYTFKRVIQNRASVKVERMINGYSGFLFLDKNGFPKVAMNLEGYMRRMQNKYKEIMGKTFPRVTPHVLRHTFCTNMQRAGIDVKSLQYLMGHSNVSVTLDIYTHTDFGSVEEAFLKIAK